MGKTIAIVILAIAVIVLLAIAFGGRQESPPCKERMKVYKVVPDCHLTDANGCILTRIHVPPLTQIRWINGTEDQVAIFFPQGSMVEGENVVIQRGDSTMTTTTATGFGDAPQQFRLRCGDLEPPPIDKVNCPPPPAPCP